MQWRKLVILTSLSAASCCAFQLARGQTDTITNAADVQALSAAEAAQARPVRLHGVVVDESQPRQRALVIMDQSGGVYVLAQTSMLAPYHRGDLVSVTGVTDPGEFAPIVKVSGARRVGSASIPPPRPVTYHQLITGSLDAQWIEISGVVQQCLAFPPSTEIERIVLSVDGGLVHVRMSGPRNPNLQEDAEVRVRALCFYQFNQKRQMLTPVLQVPAGVPITIEKPAPADPFAAPVRSAASLLQFSPGSSFGHRIHVRGTVTHGQAGSFVWIRDETSGLRLQSRSPEDVQPGDRIDVLGFPKYGSAIPTLEDAIYRKLGTTTPPAAIPLANPSEAFDHEDDLVSLEANLNEVAPILEGLVLSLDAAGTVFKATLGVPPNAHTHVALQPGSRVRIAGICSVTYDDTRPLMGVRRPQSFQLLLRSPADMTLIQAPSWWTLKHVTYLLGIATGGLLLATGVVTLLARRRLHEQEQQRTKAEVEFAAILSERNRVAREIHDTLAQGLAATSVQLRLAKKHANGSDEPLSRHLEAAHELVRGSLEEARNSIWNMRSQVLERGDLPSALNSILKQMADGSELKTEFKVTGSARRLAPVIENNLLRLGQEAITNAVRHAHARQILVQLDFSDKQFRLTVGDDGKGFDTKSPPVSNGGFGLMGMRERARELQGDLKINSQPGKGTEISLSISLPGE